MRSEDRRQMTEVRQGRTAALTSDLCPLTSDCWSFCPRRYKVPRPRQSNSASPSNRPTVFNNSLGSQGFVR